MTFKRTWDSSCPHVWSSWQDDGASWVIQDLPPEDDEEALQMLCQHLAPDEVLCIASDLVNDEESMRSMADFWRICLGQRTSLACYVEKNGERTLAAVNCCIVVSENESNDILEVEGEAWNNVYNALKYAESKANAFKILGVNTLLYAMGLVVRRDFRGARLGSRMLAAREPLCKSLGIQGTSTVFTGVASQRSAERAGFRSVAEATMRELAAAGLRYPPDDRCIKLMLKGYRS